MLKKALSCFSSALPSCVPQIKVPVLTEAPTAAPERERTGSAPALPHPYLHPKAPHGSWPLASPDATSRQRPPTPPLWAAERHRAPPNPLPTFSSPHCPPRCPAGAPHGPGADGAAGTGTRDSGWSSHPAQLSGRLCLHVQINIHEAEPKSRSQLPCEPCGSGYGAARGPWHGRQPGTARHGTEQMVRGAWPAAAASPRLLGSSHDARRGHLGLPRAGQDTAPPGQSRSSCWRGRGQHGTVAKITAPLPASPSAVQHPAPAPV